MVARARKNQWIERFLPYFFALLGQTCLMMWYVAHQDAKTNQNAEDIKQLQSIVVPRTEITAKLDDIKDRQDEQDRKLDILLSRREAKE